jgi:hypothetical protein
VAGENECGDEKIAGEQVGLVVWRNIGQQKDCVRYVHGGAKYLSDRVVSKYVYGAKVSTCMGGRRD